MGPAIEIKDRLGAEGRHKSCISWAVYFFFFNKQDFRSTLPHLKEADCVCWLSKNIKRSLSGRSLREALETLRLKRTAPMFVFAAAVENTLSPRQT